MAERAVFTFMCGDSNPPKGWTYAAHVLEPVTRNNKTTTEIFGAVVFHDDDPDVCEGQAAAFLQAKVDGVANPMKVAMAAGKAIKAAKAAKAKGG